MNTRLQVEHPVTEAVTGVDLVEWQLRVAAGEPLPCRQEDLAITGHAFEARLYAEDVPAGFLPATGRLAHLAFPQGLRADTGVAAGDEISPWYDPMIAKVIVQGVDRAAALAALRRGLAGVEVAGTVTNLAFLRALAGHEGFGRGEVDTGLIARDLAALVAVPPPARAEIAQAALMAAGLFEAASEWAGFALWQPLEREIGLEVAGAPLVVRLSAAEGGGWRLVWDGAEVLAVRRGQWYFGGHRAVPMGRFGDAITVYGSGQVIRIPDPLARGAAAGPGGDAVLAPMPGLVQAVAVAVGDRVEEADRLVVLEAMKMEHVLRAPRAGVVAAVTVAAGAQVAAGDVLVALEPVAEIEGGT